MSSLWNHPCTQCWGGHWTQEQVVQVSGSTVRSSVLHILFSARYLFTSIRHWLLDFIKWMPQLTQRPSTNTSDWNAVVVIYQHKFIEGLGAASGFWVQESACSYPVCVGSLLPPTVQKHAPCWLETKFPVVCSVWMWVCVRLFGPVIDCDRLATCTPTPTHPTPATLHRQVV